MNETFPGARRVTAAAVAATNSAPAIVATGRVPGELPMLLLLAVIQFTIAVDFIIMLPLGPQLMRAFNINVAQFNTAVAAYAFAASVSGLAAGFFIDRYDRKRALLVLYAGFTVGTLFCALAPSYPLLVAARALAGLFGGIVGGLLLAIIGDVIPEHRRGTAVGITMTAFSIAQVAGVPFGLFLANRLNWHTPFLALAGLSAIIWLGAAAGLPRLRTHLDAIGATESAGQRMRGVLFNGNHLVALALMALITLAGYLVFTDLATFLVKNVGVTEHQLPWVYICSGACTIFSMNAIGRLADRFGKRQVYTVMIFFAAAATLAVAHLPTGLRLGLVLISTTAFTVCMSGRFVPAMAYITACIEARHRGGFLSVNSAVANATAGLAAWLSGIFLLETPTSPGAATTRLTGYSEVSWASALLSIASLMLIYRLRQVEGPPAPAVPTAKAEAVDPLEAAPPPPELVG